MFQGRAGSAELTSIPGTHDCVARIHEKPRNTGGKRWMTLVAFTQVRFTTARKVASPWPFELRREPVLSVAESVCALGYAPPFSRTRSVRQRHTNSTTAKRNRLWPVLVPATRRSRPEYNLSANSKRFTFVEFAGLTRKRKLRPSGHWWISATAVVDFSLTARHEPQRSPTTRQRNLREALTTWRLTAALQAPRFAAGMAGEEGLP
jgi:hypothetical protein